jgi:hypothetical protein
MNNKSSQIRWWVIVCFQIFIMSLGLFFGIWTHIWEVDLTRISFLLIFVWATTTTFIGYNHFNQNKKSIQNFLPVGWFLSEVCLTLGMIGTVSGFLIMLVSAFSGIDLTNTTTLQSALSDMALGMGTALYTTLVGLISSLFIKSQLVNLEHLLNKDGKS